MTPGVAVNPPFLVFARVPLFRLAPPVFSVLTPFLAPLLPRPRSRQRESVRELQPCAFRRRSRKCAVDVRAGIAVTSRSADQLLQVRTRANDRLIPFRPRGHAADFDASGALPKFQIS